MITEDYVSFETAKLLKENGFDCEKQYISAMYDENGYFCSLLTTSELGGYNYEDFDDKDFIAPTLQMAMKWLRKVHKILILVEYDYPMFSSDIYKMDDIDEYGNAKHIPPTFANYKNYEQACETAIKYCLENLI